MTRHGSPRAHRRAFPEVAVHPLPSDAAEIISRTIQDTYRHFDPAVAVGMQTLAEDFVEWEAEGATVRDMKGREYVDAMTFGGVFGLGHRHPRVVAAVREQLDRMPLSSRLGFNRPLAELCRLLAEVTPGDLQYSFICSSGTESIEVALKMARLSTERTRIVSALNSFHGMSIACSSVSGIQYWREGFNPLLDGCHQVPFGDPLALEKAITPNTAAVLLEPVQAGSGCTVPPDGYLRRARELCDREGALLIMDEIQTAFGRTGRMFGVDHEGVVPDIMCLGKFLGGGVMAIGACVFNPRIQAALARRPLFNNTTFGGNPLACAAAVAAIRTVLEDNLVERSATLGERLGQGLESLKARFPRIVGEVRGRGLMRTFVLRDMRHAPILTAELLQTHRLLLLSPVHTPTMFRVNPPQIVDEAFIDRILDVLTTCFEQLEGMTLLQADRALGRIQQRMAETSRRLEAATTVPPNP